MGPSQARSPRGCCPPGWTGFGASSTSSCCSSGRCWTPCWTGRTTATSSTLGTTGRLAGAPLDLQRDELEGLGLWAVCPVPPWAAGEVVKVATSLAAWWRPNFSLNGTFVSLFWAVYEAFPETSNWGQVSADVVSPDQTLCPVGEVSLQFHECDLNLLV